jgi:hypothetical protein
MMGTLTDDRSATQLREEKEAREAREEAKHAEERERAELVQAEEAAATRAAATQNGHGRNGANVDAQDGLFDTVIEDSALEEALEAREKVKASRAALNAKFREADETAKGLLSALGLEKDTVVRIGRFRITLSEIEARSVSFETEASERLTITAAD